MSTCECGCGALTPLAPRNEKRKGWVKGQPIRFLKGHHRRKSGVDYLVDPETGCWVWQRALTSMGYGHMWNGEKIVSAHRFYYEQRFGPTDAEDLDHICGNPSCVNPKHLEPTTHAENCRRGKATKLTANDIRVIRASSASGRQIAREYGVTPALISQIRLRRIWTDIE